MAHWAELARCLTSAMSLLTFAPSWQGYQNRDCSASVEGSDDESKSLSGLSGLKVNGTGQQIGRTEEQMTPAIIGVLKTCFYDPELVSICNSRFRGYLY